MRFEIATVDFVGATIGGRRLVELAEVPQRIAEVSVNLRVGGHQSERLTVAGKSVIQQAELLEGRAEIAKRCGEIGAEGQSAPVASDSFLEAPQALQHVAEIAVRYGKVRIEAEGAPAAGLRLVQSAELIEGDAEVVVRFGKIGLEGDRPTAGRRRFFELAKVAQGRAKIAVRGGHARVDPDGSAIGGDRLVELALRGERRPERRMKASGLGNDGDRLFDHLDREVVTADAMSDFAEPVHAIGVMRIALQHAAVERERLVQPPGPMHSQRIREQTRDGAAVGRLDAALGSVHAITRRFCVAKRFMPMAGRLVAGRSTPANALFISPALARPAVATQRGDDASRQIRRRSLRGHCTRPTRPPT